FLVRVEIGYPEAAFELGLYSGADPETQLTSVHPVLTLADLLALRAAANEVQVRPPVAEYAYRVVQASRRHGDVQLGASPRAALAWLRAARARALLDGRHYVLPDDLKALAVPALAHRIFLRGEGPADALVRELVRGTEVPL
ncbi:MAG: ATPase, partial [Planctomycetota bacterium]